MEVSSSVKSQYPRIRLSYNAYCFIDSKRKPILNCQLNFNFPGSFHHIKGQRLVLNSSYSEGGPISELGLENMPLSVELEPISSESQFDRVVAEAHQLEESVIVLWMASWCRKCIYLKPKLEKLAADYYPRIRFYSVDVNNVPHKLIVRAGVTLYPLTDGPLIGPFPSTKLLLGDQYVIFCGKTLEYWSEQKHFELSIKKMPTIQVQLTDIHNYIETLQAGTLDKQLWKDGEKQAEVIGGHKAYLVVNEVREMIESENSM